LKAKLSNKYSNDRIFQSAEATMIPSELQASSFHAYPPEAQTCATQRIDLLRRMPLGFVSLLLREVITYDWKFPAERKDLERQFSYLGSLSREQFERAMQPFVRLRLSSELERADWVNSPGIFSEQLSSHLWATNQIDQFRGAAIRYVQEASGTQEVLPQPRIGIVVIGRGVAAPGYALFRKLRPHGVYYPHVDPEGAWEVILRSLALRAEANPEPYAHWYIDGATPTGTPAGVTAISYTKLTSARSRLQSRMQKSFESGMGPENLRTSLASIRPEDVGLENGLLNRFQLRLLTEASGTQIFSTTFVQWAAREAWRRAQPLTLVARFAPRQLEKSMKDMLAEARTPPELDPRGSLVDADMGAYYTWLNQQRLAGGDSARFIAWSQEHRQAVAIGPELPKGTESAAPINFSSLLGAAEPTSK